MRARTNHRRIAALALGAVMLAGIAPVHAADIVYEEPPAPQPVPIENAPVASWIGPYLGVYSGYGFGGQTQGATGGTISTNGWLFGGFADATLAVYEHHHDHTHLPDGTVRHADGSVTEHCHPGDGHHESHPGDGHHDHGHDHDHDHGHDHAHPARAAAKPEEIARTGAGGKNA